MSKKKAKATESVTDEVIIPEEEQKMINKIMGVAEPTATTAAGSTAAKVKGNAVEVYLKNVLNKNYKGKSPLSLLSDAIKTMDKDEFVELFQYMLNVFKNSSEDTKDTENEIKKLLTENSYVFTVKYFEYLADVLPIVKTLSKRVDFSCTPIFSQDPTPAIYGAVRKEKGGQHFIPPLKGEQFKQIIDAYLANNLPYYAGLWLFAICNFVPEKVCNEFTAETRKGVMDAAKDIRNLMVSDATYQTALGYYYCSAGADEVTKIIRDENSAKVRITSLERESDGASQALKQSQETIQYQQTQLEELRRRTEALDEFRRQADILKLRIEDIGERYTLQVGINENLEKAHQEKKAALEAKIKELADRVAQLTTEFATISQTNEELTIENNNLQSDLEGERIKLAKIKEDTDKLLLAAKNDVISDFVSFIAEPINHFARAFAYFEANKEFDEMTLEICIESLNEIISGLKDFDIHPIGEFGAVVAYNRDLHYCEGSIMEGASVQVEKIGWMLGNNVIKKADVETVEE